MKLVNSMEQNIYLSGGVVNTDSFKDDFVDKLLKIRDDVSDEYNEFPTIGMSSNTLSWFRRLFRNDTAYDDGIIERFWLMPIHVVDMRDGLIDFYIGDKHVS